MLRFMERRLDPLTGDYAAGTAASLENAVYLRIMTPLGSWWADPALGSLLYTLAREKDVSRVFTLAAQYAEQALAPLVSDGRATAVTASASRLRPGWLQLLITVNAADGTTQTFRHPVKVS